MRNYPCYVIDFISDFAYETGWDPIQHCSFKEFKSGFDKFYNSSDEYYIIFLHDWTFLDYGKEINETKADAFEKVINYIFIYLASVCFFYCFKLNIFSFNIIYNFFKHIGLCFIYFIIII